MKISKIANSILKGLDNLEVHTPFSDRLNSDYLRARKEIVMEHLRQESIEYYCNCIEWKDLTAGWCPIHKSVNSCV